MNAHEITVEALEAQTLLIEVALYPTTSLRALREASAKLRKLDEAITKADPLYASYYDADGNSILPAGRS